MTQAVTEAKPQIKQLYPSYVKNISLEFPSAPSYFPQPTDPALSDAMSINAAITTLSAGAYEVALTATVTLTRENKTVYLLEVTQAGLFGIENTTDEQVINQILRRHCTQIVLNHLRVTVGELSVRTQIAPIQLPDVDWDKAWQNSDTQRKQAASAQPALPAPSTSYVLNGAASPAANG